MDAIIPSLDDLDQPRETVAEPEEKDAGKAIGKCEHKGVFKRFAWKPRGNQSAHSKLWKDGH